MRTFICFALLAVSTLSPALAAGSVQDYARLPTTSRGVDIGFGHLSKKALPSGAGMKWNSMPLFIGQCIDQYGNSNTCFLEQIQSTTVDGQGYYETWTLNVNQVQESYADHGAIQARAACNATGDNSCVLGVPGWQETLNISYVVKN